METKSKDDGRAFEERFADHFKKVAAAEAQLQALRDAHAKRMQS